MSTKVRGGKRAGKYISSLSEAIKGGFKVGFPTESSGGITYPDGKAVVDVAMFNELGTDTIPPRPSLLNGAMEYVKTGKSNRARIAKGITSKKITVEKALDLMGSEASAAHKKSIRDLDDPENADSTIKNKGSSNPLIDTGLMIQSATFKRIM